MNINIKILKKIFIVIVFTFTSITVHAANTPSLSLTNTSDIVTIGVTGADSNAIVTFSYPNTSVTNTNGTISYTSIDIGQTNANGTFTIPIAINSYGLTGGSLVYISVHSVQSSKVAWPTSATASTQSGTLAMYRPDRTLIIGETASIFASNSANILTVQSNSNPSVLSASILNDNNSLFLTALSVGNSAVTVCASTDGCTQVRVTVKGITENITFSQNTITIAVNQPAQAISIYGGSSYTVTNTNKDAISASIDGNKLSISSFNIGKAVVTVCATGFNCGFVTVTSVASGTVLPTATINPVDIGGDFSKPPQLANFGVSSNNAYNLFFGNNSTLTFTFSINQTSKNVLIKVGDSMLSTTQTSNGSYVASYRVIGNEKLPLPISISFANPQNLTGSFNASLGSQVQVSPSLAQSSSGEKFTKYLYEGMTKLNVSDTEVLSLQKVLKDMGLYSGPLTGYFGSVTKKAVQAFQKKNNLDQLGAVGPATRALLNK